MARDIAISQNLTRKYASSYEFSTDSTSMRKLHRASVTLVQGRISCCPLLVYININFVWFDEFNVRVVNARTYGIAVA